jgi:hypothetical protein
LAPDDRERAALAQRVAEINNWFAPGARNKIRQLVGQVLGAMPHRDQDMEDVAGDLDVYGHALEVFPLFAVKAACERALRGEVGGGPNKGRFRPTPAELAMACKAEMKFFLDEKRLIIDILNAEVMAPRPVSPRRAELAAKAWKLIEEIAQARPPNEVERGYGAPVQALVNDGLSPEERAELRLAELKKLNPPSSAIGHSRQPGYCESVRVKPG